MKAAIPFALISYLVLLSHVEAAWKRPVIRMDVLDDDLDLMLETFQKEEKEQAGAIKFGKLLGFKVHYNESASAYPYNRNWSPEEILRLRCFETAEKKDINGALFYRNGRTYANGTFDELPNNVAAYIPLFADELSNHYRARVPLKVEVPYIDLAELKTMLRGRWNKMRNGRKVLTTDYVGLPNTYVGPLSYTVKLTYDEQKDKLVLGGMLKGLYGREQEHVFEINKMKFLGNVEYDGNNDVVTSNGEDIKDVAWVRFQPNSL